jgi:hypothetical protein
VSKVEALGKGDHMLFRAHYPGTVSSAVALQTGKPLWASEDYSTVDDLVGGGCWARVSHI